jgi:hypothetical protein
VERWKGGIGIGYGSNAKVGNTGQGQLEYWVGVWFNRKQSRLLNERKTLLEQVKAQGFEIDIDDDGCAIGIGALADRFVTTDATESMDSQAQRIADWMRPHLTGLLALKPGAYSRWLADQAADAEAVKRLTDSSRRRGPRRR